jgi:tungstate transport system substrate-binding protein
LRFALAALALAGAARAEEASRPLVLATTTSVRDAGLMDELLPVFEKETGIQVQLIAVGSGAALAMGEKGDADVLVTHDPDAEQALVAKRALVDHRPFLENYYLIAGPADDPARVGETSDAVDAVRRIAAAKAPYASRGDDSGTHRREQKLFEKAGLAANPTWDGLVRTGQGMGATLQVAGEKRAYALTDTSSFESFRERVDLAPVFARRSAELRNVYAVSRPNPEMLPPGRVDVARGRQLAEFLTSPATLERVRAFRVVAGRPLFEPIESAP